MLKPIISSFVFDLILVRIGHPHGSENYSSARGQGWRKLESRILLDGTLYVSGMGGEDANGKIPADFGR